MWAVCNEIRLTADGIRHRKRVIDSFWSGLASISILFIKTDEQSFFFLFVWTGLGAAWISSRSNDEHVYWIFIKYSILYLLDASDLSGTFLGESNGLLEIIVGVANDFKPFLPTSHLQLLLMSEFICFCLEGITVCSTSKQWIYSWIYSSKSRTGARVCWDTSLYPLSWSKVYTASLLSQMNVCRKLPHRLISSVHRSTVFLSRCKIECSQWNNHYVCGQWTSMQCDILSTPVHTMKLLAP